MSNLTQKELFTLEDSLGAEALLVKKFSSYAASAQDQQIRASAEQMAGRHKQHFDSLLAYLY